MYVATRDIEVLLCHIAPHLWENTTLYPLYAIYFNCYWQRPLSKRCNLPLSKSPFHQFDNPMVTALGEPTWRQPHLHLLRTWLPAKLGSKRKLMFQHQCFWLELLVSESALVSIILLLSRSLSEPTSSTLNRGLKPLSESFLSKSSASIVLRFLEMMTSPSFKGGGNDGLW